MPNDENLELNTQDDSSHEDVKSQREEPRQENHSNDNEHSEENKTFSSDYVKKLRKESANYRLQASELQRKAEEAERKTKEHEEALKASKEEAQKALHESKRLNSTFERRVINAELKAAAAESGLIDLDAFRMVDTSSVKINDDGEVVGAKELIASLKKDKPYLFKEVNTSNKNAVAPDINNAKAEKPTYNTQQEFEDAKRKWLASLK